jgi:hypothetical protein
MISIDPQDWARKFAADLTLGGERVPFDRVLRAHAPTVAVLRAQGLTWASLARLLGRAGVRRVEGKPYSADHLRVAFQRFSRGGSAANNQLIKPRSVAAQTGLGSPPPSRHKQHHTPQVPLRGATPVELQARAAAVITTSNTPDGFSDQKDISDEELDSVLSRLNRSK